jgi:glutathione synthase/RimK-type ligase-like ATP-grasp enzyme
VSARVLVMGAGSGAVNNLIAALCSALPALTVVGAHHDPFTLRKSVAERNYLLSSATDDVPDIARIVAREAIDLVIPSTDAEVKRFSDNRDALAGRLFLPQRAVVDRCQDKCDLASFLAMHDVPVPASLPVTSYRDLGGIFEKLGPASRVWCRVRSGSRSLGAAPVASARQARAWIEHWEMMRGIDPASFMVAEYLPGRDFFCQSLWKSGGLVLVKTCERVSYFGGENTPSGASSLYSLAKTVVDDRVVDVSSRALRALDPALTGAFGVDLKENADGVPCVTEINAGRFVIGMTTIGSIGRHNMPACYVRLALGESLAVDDPYDCPPDYYVVRDLDTPAGVFHADDIVDHFLKADV